MITFAIQSGLCWGLFYLIYTLLLSHQTHYRLNRSFLLGGLLLGLVCPWVSGLQLWDTALVEPTGVLPTVYVGWQQFEELAIQADQVIVQPATFNWWYLLYLAGLSIGGARLLYGLVSIGRLVSGGQKIYTRTGIPIILTPGAPAPYSFLCWIFWHPELSMQNEEGRYMLRHEQAHIQLGHSFDLLLVELLTVIFWFNPILYCYKKSIRNVHEYQADAAVLRKAPLESYGRLLLYQAKYTIAPNLVANHFFNSQIKKRIVMMTKEPSTWRTIWKYALIIPAVLFVSWILADQPTFASHESTDNISLDIFAITDPDELPRFPGCEDEQDTEARKMCSMRELISFISKELKYPAAAKEAGIEGTVLVSFIIDEKGVVKQLKIEKDLGYACGEEVMRVMQAMPRWVPGSKDGKAVSVEMKLPVQFKLDQKVKKQVDQMPVFAGCADADDPTACSNQKLIAFIGENLRYPEAARDNKIEGPVVVSFVVQKDGSVADVKALKGIGGGCEEEVMRVIYSMPNWQPGQNNDRPEAVQLTLPVKFVLDNAQSMAKSSKAAKDLGLTEFRVGPNPNKGQLDIQFKAPAAATMIRVFDLNGKVVFEQTLNTFDGFYQKQIDLSEQTKGVFFLQIRQGKNVFTEKLVVQ